MTLHELERKLVELDELRTELKSTIDEVKSEVGEKPKPPHPRWWPMDDNAYYYIYNNMAHRTYWGNNYFDMGTYSVGNVFKTEEATKFAIERLKVLAEMREWAGNNHCGVYIYYHKPRDCIMMNWDGDSDYFFGDIRFNSVGDAENCIQAVGKERIKKYYFMVPEDEK